MPHRGLRIALAYRVPDGTLTHQELQHCCGAEVVDKFASASVIRNRRVISDARCVGS